MPKAEFPKFFGSLKTQQFTDPTARGSTSVVHRTIAWNNTGTLIATGATDRVVRIWNPERTNINRPQAELKGHTGEITKVLFNPVKESELVSCSRDRSVRFWDTRSKTCTTKLNLEVEGPLISMSWSVDGTAMVVGSLGSDSSDGSKAEYLTTISTDDSSSPIVLERHAQKSEANQTAFSMAYPPQDLLVTYNNGSVKIFDYPSFDTLHTISSHTANCTSIAYSPLGNYVAVGGSDAIIALWDTYDWVCKRTMSNPKSGKVTGLSWSWDGRYLTSSSEDVGSGGDGKSEGFEIYHAETGDVVFTVPTKNNSITSVAWHPKMYTLAYTCVEAGKSSLRIIGDVAPT